MDVGVGVTSSDGHNLWWVAGESISEERPVGFKRQI